MNSSLIPTAIVDKNGKHTVVHKSLAGTNPASKALAGAAPKLDGSTKKRSPKPFAPSKKQLEQNGIVQRIYRSMVDPQLSGAVETSLGRELGGSWSPLIRITDVEGYGVISAVDTVQNALALMAAGIRSADEAYDFLTENNLEHIAREENPLIQGALERRISLVSFIDFDANFNGITEMTPEVHLDTAEAHSSPSLRELPEIVHGIRDETISLQDVKDVGITTLSKAETRFQIPEILKGIKAGTKNYTAKQLGNALKKSTDSMMEYTMIRMLQKYGGDVADSIKYPNVVSNMHDVGRKDGLSEDEMQAAAVYGDKFMQQTYLHHTYVYELFKAGVDVDFAVKAYQENNQLTTNEVIGLYNGAAAPLIDGWL